MWLKLKITTHALAQMFKALCEKEIKVIKFSGKKNQIEDFDNFIIKEGVGVYTCTVCSFVQKSLPAARNHVESKHFPDIFTYSCPACDKSFKTNNADQWHMRNLHK